MEKIRWIGRGGQGAFTASKILGSLAIENGFFALAFPSFGPERRGAPLEAYTKISSEKISNRTALTFSNYIVILDETLFKESYLNDLEEGGKILLNSSKKYDDERILSIDATSLSFEILKKPITNTAMLGALLGCINYISSSSLEEGLKKYLSAKIVEKNLKIIEIAAEYIRGVK